VFLRAGSDLIFRQRARVAATRHDWRATANALNSFPLSAQ
jgi:hypothetical protein